MKRDIDKRVSRVWMTSEAAKSLVGSMEKECGMRFSRNYAHHKDHHMQWGTLEEENERIGNFLEERFK